MKIHYFSGETWEDAYVRAKLPGEDIDFHEGSLAACPELTDADADILCTFVESRIGEEELDRFPALKLIATRSTGFDHINLAAAAARGIKVANGPSYLAGKTLGVIGCGHIGTHVIRMGNGFGMRVIGFDAYPNADLAETLGFTYVPLAELLAASDIVTLHVPYNEHTHHLLNRENIGMLKKGAYLINTSRGAVVETEALIEALQNGTLAGAGLDVLEEEGDLNDETALLAAPHPNAKELKIVLENHYLISHPRVIVTPHLAFNTQEAVERILDTTIENIQKFAAGSPINLVS